MRVVDIGMLVRQRVSCVVEDEFDARRQPLGVLHTGIEGCELFAMEDGIRPHERRQARLHGVLASREARKGECRFALATAIGRSREPDLTHKLRKHHDRA